jgi:signal transduction histidine kinase/ligand-binding sensor domain-containing protein/DNA-binding response OmpR family regulator
LKYYFSILLTYLSILTSGQESRFFTAISRSSGLSSNSVTAIAQDHEGFIWIGTKSGINRYDGKELIHFDSGNSSLKSNDVTAIKVDVAGTIWVGFLAGGLAKYDPIATDFMEVKNAPIKQDVTVHELYQNDASELWVLADVGIIKLAEDKNTQLPDAKKFDLGNQQYTSMVSWHGRYWIGSYNGSLVEMDSTRKINEYYISKSTNRASNRIWSILPVSKDQLLVGTQNTGLLTFDISTGTFSSTGVDASIVHSIVKDHNGHLWIGTDGEGIFEIDLKGKTHNYRHIYGNKNSIASNAITCILEDKDGNIWFGTAWDGVSVISNQSKDYKFYYSDFKGEKSTGVLSILYNEGRLWLGSDGEGINCYPTFEKEWPEIRKHLGSKTHPQFIKKLNDGSYWIGTFKNGLYQINLNNRKIQHYQNEPNAASSISHNDVRDIEFLGNGTYLVATWGGGLNVFHANTGEFTTFSHTRNQESPNNIVSLCKTPSGDILIATFGEGLFSFNDDTKSLRKIFPGRFKNSVCVYSDKENSWIGTWGEGMFKMSNAFDSIVHIMNGDLPANANILSILPDEKGGVYVSTKEGIYHINERNEILKIKGLNGQYHINSAYKDMQGRYYFGNTEGVVSFSDSINEITATSNVKLVNIKLFGESLHKVDLKKPQLKLKHDQNVLTFEFAALVYPVSSDVEYMFMVEPQNTDWIKLGTQRSITLANLNPGSYTIRFKTTTGNQTTSFSFEISNPWWTSWWALLAYLILFLLLLYAYRLYAVRLEKLQGRLSLEKLSHEKEAELNTIKQKLFINISHEIRTPLTLIMGEIERLTSKTITNQSIANIRSNSNYIMQLINELLDYSKLESDELKLHVAEDNFILFSKEIFLAFQNMAEMKDINYSFHSTLDDIPAWYDRDQFEKVLFNLLSNAFKYTDSGGAIKLEIQQYDQIIKIAVSDTGRGIPPNQLQNIFKRFYQSDNAIQISDSGFGIGLSIVSDIVKLHHGKVWVESQIEKGTTIFVTFPLGKNHFSPNQLSSNFLDSESIELYKDEKQTEDESRSSTKEELILIVEDNVEIRNFIGEVLQDQFRIAEAENGLKGLEMIDRELPDLIISDVMMPEMDGITFLQKIKSKISTSHIPVILLTARTGLAYKKEGYDTGADDYLTKPFSSSLLKARIRNILQNRHVIHEKIKNEYLTKTKEINLLPLDEQFLLNITTVVDKHLGNAELDAGLISLELGMSHSVVYKKLKSLTGLNIVEFIRDYKLSQAAKLLTSYHLSVSETCNKVGFSDTKYFSQIFKKKFNMTPSDYVKDISKNPTVVAD